MRCVWRRAVEMAGIAALVVGSVPAAAIAQEKKSEATAMEEVLEILKKEGIIDDATRERVLAKQVASEKKQTDVATGLAGFEWFGDLRVRYEAFSFSDDDLIGTAGADDRSRERYRARLGFKKRVNDRLTVGLRIASGAGSGDLRSTNTSFGDGAGDNDRFAPDGIFIDQAWFEVKAMDSGGFKLGFTAGKVGNPYVGKVGIDFLIFDNDINPEGLYLSTSFRPSEPVLLYGTLGGFIIDEDSGAKDPKLLGLQLGTTLAPSENTSFGFRGSLFEFRSLDDTFIRSAISSGAPSSGGGNLAGAFGEDSASNATLAGNNIGSDPRLDGKARLLEGFTSFTFGASEAFPVTLFGTYVKNLEAESNTFISATNTLTIDDEDTAWGAGIEFGSSKKSVLLGFAYYSVEANSVVASFTDSDLFDGFTNREGFVAYLGREIVKNVDFRLAYFDGEEIEDDLLGGVLLTSTAQPLGPSLLNADRRRLQADISVKF
jgi:hypothetical protein